MQRLRDRTIARRQCAARRKYAALAKIQFDVPKNCLRTVRMVMASRLKRGK
jgi:hypothetical protein